MGKTQKDAQYNYSHSHRHRQIFKLNQKYTHMHIHVCIRTLAHTDFSVLELAEMEVSTGDLLSLLWIQVTESDSVEGVVSSEEEPMARTSDKQNER